MRGHEASVGASPQAPQCSFLLDSQYAIVAVERILEVKKGTQGVLESLQLRVLSPLSLKGIRAEVITRTAPVTGAYAFIPSLQTLRTSAGVARHIQLRQYVYAAWPLVHIHSSCCTTSTNPRTY